MKIILLLGISIGCILACEQEQVFQPVQQTPFEQWHSFNLHHYTIDQMHSCFCPNGGDLVRVTVRSDTLFSVIRINDNRIVPTSYSITVDSLFGIIRNLSKDSLVIRYNSQYGYPEYLDVNPQLHPIDGGFLFETFNLQVP